MDDQGLERRKVNEFDDGRREFADEIQETQYTTFGDQIMPSIEEINSFAELTATGSAANHRKPSSRQGGFRSSMGRAS